MEDKGIFDSGCSWHMTGNKDHLDDFAECKGGSITFGGSKSYITGKGRIKVGNLEFDSVSFVKELGHFNLFSISQICDKQHKVLFTETECLVVTPDFKMPDENQILLKVPRQHNMYSFDMKTPGPAKSFACLIAKATSNKSKLWHRRSNNGTEFKNRDMLEFYGNKGIKQEYSNARTPQQNGVAKKMNRTLIEAARTMLADSLLPTTFWAEAVSTACNIFNRVRVTKPQNKTPYELLFGHKPIISYIRLFGCNVTILDTLSVLGKFDGKCDEGFLVDIKSASEKVSSGSEHVSQRQGKTILEDTPQTKRTKKQIKEEQASLAKIARIQAEDEAENERREELKRQDELAAKRLQEELELSEAQKKRMAQVQEAAQFYTEENWDIIWAKLEANANLKKSRKRTGEELQIESSKKLKSDTREDVSVPKEKDKESVKKEEGFEIKKPVLRYTKRKSLGRKGLQRKPESAKSGTEEDVEAYMEERVDEPSSEEFPMSSIPQGPAPAKIVKWQIIKTGKRGAYQIIREDNTDVVYVNFQGLLNDLTRDDLKELYRLMMLKYGDNRPEEEFERVLWGDLKTMFDPPSTEDAVWNLTHQQKVLSWRYFHSCVVHCLTLEAAHIYMLKRRFWEIEKIRSAINS
ncbi:ribonuclease H-like domain-containing protein [Tanacetum coccineum]|uniref:Ribonuclease H-like domain-containing protein n=1 Tax=Tanacetum coccineum TaxID=301880 RepID=A0ABQ5DYI2_9ASTR